MWFEENLVFFPSKYPSGEWNSIPYVGKDRGLAIAIEDCSFRTDDGVAIHGWYGTATPLNRPAAANTHSPSMVLLWCHGNAGNVTHRLEQMELMLRIPVNILVFDYRGYGRSEGQPSESGIYKDTAAAWRYLTQERGYGPRDIILYGKSLGGACAVELAQSVAPGGLIFQSSFTSVPDMAAATMPFIPRMIIRTQMDNLAKIPFVSCPKLFIHSPADEIVPFEQGQRLFAAATGPKEFYELPNAGHNETYIVGGDEFLRRIGRFIEQCAARR